MDFPYLGIFPARRSCFWSFDSFSDIGVESAVLESLCCVRKGTLVSLLRQVRRNGFIGTWPTKRKASFREAVPAQPVDATPSDIDLFSKGGVYDARETGEALCDAEDRHVEPLEGGTVVA